MAGDASDSALASSFFLFPVTNVTVRREAPADAAIAMIDGPTTMDQTGLSRDDGRAES